MLSHGACSLAYTSRYVQVIRTCETSTHTQTKTECPKPPSNWWQNRRAPPPPYPTTLQTARISIMRTNANPHEHCMYIYSRNTRSSPVI
ncbi:uncharacterized protein P884DRAFT_8476 [Thermothelomyces heterothallicus CBS 202.75]|uniref:uncharacterized protein n=1 Tax=Thermothelomyces heterothallicus CBS 202.75 TaxID=1149848 RepID=UPI003744680F